MAKIIPISTKAVKEYSMADFVLACTDMIDILHQIDQNLKNTPHATSNTHR